VPLLRWIGANTTWLTRRCLEKESFTARSGQSLSSVPRSEKTRNLPGPSTAQNSHIRSSHSSADALGIARYESSGSSSFRKHGRRCKSQSRAFLLCAARASTSASGGFFHLMLRSSVGVRELHSSLSPRLHCRLWLQVTTLK